MANTTSTATALVMMLTLTAAVHAGSVLYVDDDAPPGGDGTGWNVAYRFLQDALADGAQGDVIEIRVAQGVYQPDRSEETPDGTGDRRTSFHLVNGVALMGGYAGIGAKNPDDRDIELYETILTGDLQGNDGPDFANNDENGYNVTTGSGTDGTAVLDGFSVTAGNANGPDTGELNWIRGAGMWNLAGSPTVSNCTFSGNAANFGGGMVNDTQSSPTITNCTFTGNTAVRPGPAGIGGGMINSSQSNPTISECTFSGNFTNRHGGGMFNFGSSPTITACTFDSNTADVRGGGMLNDTDSSPMVTGCLFIANSATTGGGVNNRSQSNPIITNCTFTGNMSVGGGGGMRNTNSSPTVTNCTFNNNTAVLSGGGMRNLAGSPTVSSCTFSGNTTPHDGGGMANISSNPTVTDCTFDSNFATQYGGGMRNSNSSPKVTGCTFTGNMSDASGGGVFNFQSSPMVTNCTFKANEAHQTAGGMGNDSSSPTVTNCTFVENSAELFGGGVSSTLDSFPTITSCTFSGNTAPEGGGIYTTDAIGGHSETTVVNTIAWGNKPDQIGNEAGATTTINYSDLQGGWFGGGSNNIDADPLFVAPGSGDYRLSPGSPCIDAGNNWGVPIDENDYDEDGIFCELLPIDLDGNPRFNADEADFDPGCGIPVVVDMGAYEYQFDPTDQVTLADLNADGAVGVADLLELLASWGPCGKGCCLADLHIDGAVGLSDLLALLANWGPCP